MKLLRMWIQQYGVDILVFTGITCFSFWLMWSTFHIESRAIHLDSRLYSDFAVHLPLIRSFSMADNLPPEYPFVAGQPIRYHYLFYLAVGWLESAGIPLDWALNTLSAVGMIVLLVMIYRTSILFFNSKYAGIISIILALFNGSLSFIQVLPDTFSVAAVWEAGKQIVGATEFASFGPWDGNYVSAFWNWNVYTNQRHLALSFGLVLAAFYPLLAGAVKQNYRLRWYHLLGLGTCAVLFPLLHQAGSLIFLGMSLGWLVWYWHKLTLQLKITYLISCTLVAMSWAYFVWQTGSQQLAFQLGFLAKNNSLKEILLYWFHNLGLYLLLLPILLIQSRKKMGIVLILAFGLFAVANLVRLSTDMINNHKFINFFWIIVQIATAGWLVQNWTRWWQKTLIVLLFPFLILSGVIDTFPVIHDRSTIIPTVEASEAQQWIKAHTPVRSQFLSTTYLYNPASLVGRQLYLDYGYHAWSMGYDDHTKRSRLVQFFATEITSSEWCDLAEQEKIDYVIISPWGDDFQGVVTANDSWIIKQHPSYESPDGYRIISVYDVCTIWGV